MGADKDPEIWPKVNHQSLKQKQTERTAYRVLQAKEEEARGSRSFSISHLKADPKPTAKVGDRAWLRRLAAPAEGCIWWPTHCLTLQLLGIWTFSSGPEGVCSRMFIPTPTLMCK